MGAMENPLRAYRDREGVSQAALAARLGVQPPAVCKWERGRIPPERVLDIERETGISRHDLRPDIYGPAQAAAE